MTAAQIGNLPWTREEMIGALSEFTTIYATRPIKHNVGGMLAPHMFSTWFAMRKLQPKVIIESGVWHGQGTWLLERACPMATIHSIDLNLSLIKYKSERAIYHNQDFATIDWSELPLKDTVIFFDDHQNAYERLKAVAWLGFKKIFFEDNYPPGRGDCYSLKMALSDAGFAPEKRTVQPVSKKSFWRKTTAIKNDGSGKPVILPNKADSAALRRNLSVYYEMPPVIRTPFTRWGDPWDDVRYPTGEPLLHEVTSPELQIYLDEAKSYTWICYVELK